MWFLYAIQDDQETTRTLLRPGLMYTLGRKGADIIHPIIEKSISRKHATLNIEQNTTENWDEFDGKPYVYFHDLGSKSGSFINDVRVEGVSLDQGVYLKDGDTLKIGTKTGLFRLTWQSLTICRQAMPSADKQKLVNGARAIGAKITQSVRSPYSHLLMPSIQISYKVARCLAEGKPVVSQKWLDTLVDLPDKDYTFPPVADYLPPIDASCEGPLGVPDFTPNQEREHLFTGKRFIFFDEEQHQQLSSMVETCHGESVLLNINKTDPFEDQLGNENTIVIESEKLYETHAGKNIINALDSFQKRLVRSMEICWAILYCSIDVECNSRYGISASDSTSHNNATTSGALGNEPGNATTADSPLSSSAIHIPSSSSTPLSSPTTQTRLPQERQNSGQASSKLTTENSTSDLDDFFDQIVGDEPSRPPPTTKIGSRESAISQTPQTPLNLDRTDHQDNNILLSDELTIAEQTTDEHHDSASKETIDKGKGRIQEPATLSNYDGTPSMDDDIEGSSTGRKSKKPRTGKNNNSTAPPTAPRKPYILPELENENADITTGKNYTKVVYTTLVAAPSPENWTARRQQQHQQQQCTSGGINYKKFRKVPRPTPNDALRTVGMMARIHSDTEEPEPLPAIDEDDFSDIRIRPNAPRATMWL